MDILYARYASASIVKTSEICSAEVRSLHIQKLLTSAEHFKSTFVRSLASSITKLCFRCINPHKKNLKNLIMELGAKLSMQLEPTYISINLQQVVTSMGS